MTVMLLTGPIKSFLIIFEFSFLLSSNECEMESIICLSTDDDLSGVDVLTSYSQCIHATLPALSRSHEVM